MRKVKPKGYAEDLHAKKIATPLKKKKLTKRKTSTAKVKVKTKAKVKAAPESHGSRRGFMWKILELKEQRLKQRGGHMPAVESGDKVHPTATQDGYARFNGPRRRVG